MAVSTKAESVTSSSTMEVQVACPPDKSISHRALMLASLAHEDSYITGYSKALDCNATLATLKNCGLEIEEEVCTDPQALNLKVKRRDKAPFLESPEVPLDFANSGTTARLFLGLAAAQRGFTAHCRGDDSLSLRPMERVARPLQAVGAHLSYAGAAGRLPIQVRGEALQAIRCHIPVASAQVKSALLLAALQTPGWHEISLPAGSRDHTELMLSRMGVAMTRELSGGVERLGIKGMQNMRAVQGAVPKDPSAFAFWCLWALLHPGVSIVAESLATNPRRCHYLEVLQEMGLAVKLTPTPGSSFLEEVQQVRVSRQAATLSPVVIESKDIPLVIDELPMLMAAAAFCEGTSRFLGAGELRVKEADRLQKMVELLSLTGAKVTVLGDDLTVTGGLSLGNGAPFCFDAASDHRLAMVAMMLATAVPGSCTILGADCVAVSYPSFVSELRDVQTRYRCH